MKRKWIAYLLLFVCLLFVGSLFARPRASKRHPDRHNSYKRHRHQYRRQANYYFFPFVTIYGQRDYHHYGEVYSAPPRRKIERRPPRPSDEHVWVEGNWAYDRRWVWVPGEWIYPPREGMHWEPGYWKKTNRGWVYIQGRWR